jgi:hypothetical protein
VAPASTCLYLENLASLVDMQDANERAEIGEFFGVTLRARWGDAKISLGDGKSSLGDAKSSLGDAKSSLGDAKSSLGDGSGEDVKEECAKFGQVLGVIVPIPTAHATASGEPGRCYARFNEQVPPLAVLTPT